METRVSKIVPSQLDTLLTIDIRHSGLLHFVKTLRRCSSLSSVNLLSSKLVNVKCEYCNGISHSILIDNGNFVTHFDFLLETLEIYRNSFYKIDPRPSINQSTSLKSGSLFLLMVSVRPSVHTYVRTNKTY